MTPEAQRIAAAKIHGWKVMMVRGYFCLFNPSGKQKGGRWTVEADAWTQKGHGASSFLPDYLNDLNAIHEVEEHSLLTVHQVTCYGIELAKLIFNSHKSTPREHAHSSWRAPYIAHCDWFSSAATRAEALIKTFALWEESK